MNSAVFMKLRSGRGIERAGPVAEASGTRGFTPRRAMLADTPMIRARILSVHRKPPVRVSSILIKTGKTVPPGFDISAQTSYITVKVNNTRRTDTTASKDDGGTKCPPIHKPFRQLLKIGRRISPLRRE